MDDYVELMNWVLEHQDRTQTMDEQLLESALLFISEEGLSGKFKEFLDASDDGLYRKVKPG